MRLILNRIGQSCTQPRPNCWEGSGKVTLFLVAAVLVFYSVMGGKEGKVSGEGGGGAAVGGAESAESG